MRTQVLVQVSSCPILRNGIGGVSDFVIVEAATKGTS